MLYGAWPLLIGLHHGAGCLAHQLTRLNRTFRTCK
jgi:hypothetical protein